MIHAGSKLKRTEALVGEKLKPREIAERLDTTLGSVRTMLWNLRRTGRIGMWDGREDDDNCTNLPLPNLLLRLTTDVRSALDLEAEDRGTTPAALAIRILSTVLADQALVDAVLGEE